jgi:hypothetical protein
VVLSPLLAGLIAFILVRTSVLNVFYSAGDMIDPGWFSTLAWHSTWRLAGPPAFSGSFFADHMSPIFWLTSAVSYVLPLPKIEFFAAVLGATYALFAAGVCRAWQMGDERAGLAQGLAAVAIALAATFSAVGMQALRLPHHEMMIPAFGLWFFIAMAERSYRWAAVWFVLCLMVREDAGFHLAGILVLWGLAVTFYRQAYSEARPIWYFAIAALGYAALAFLFMHTAFAPNVFSRVYSGDPPWHHLTAQFLSERFWFYLTERSYATLPLLVTLVWAAFSRNPLLPLGYIACLPWMAMHFLAFGYTSGTLSYYYSFPLWLGLAWPLVALHLWPRENTRRAVRWPYLLVLLPSLVGWKFDNVIVYPLAKHYFPEHPFAVTAELLNREAYDNFSRYFIANKSKLGDAAMDMAVFGLLIDDSNRKNWITEQKEDHPPEVIMYFDGGFEWPRIVPILRRGLYTQFYQVPGTKIRVAAQRPLEGALPQPMPFVAMTRPSY